jgi:hypothetical protein
MKKIILLLVLTLALTIVSIDLLAGGMDVTVTCKGKSTTVFSPGGGHTTVCDYSCETDCTIKVIY